MGKRKCESGSGKVGVGTWEWERESGSRKVGCCFMRSPLLEYKNYQTGLGFFSIFYPQKNVILIHPNADCAGEENGRGDARECWDLRR